MLALPMRCSRARACSAGGGASGVRVSPAILRPRSSQRKSGRRSATRLGPAFVAGEPVRLGRPEVGVHEGEHAAARTAGDDAFEPLHGGLAEVGREVGDDEEVVFFGDDSGLVVVFRDVVEFVAQIHLDDFFDVPAEDAEAFLDLLPLGPDAVVDQAVLVVGEVHQPAEILAEPDGVDDGEGSLARAGWRRAGGG